MNGCVYKTLAGKDALKATSGLSSRSESALKRKQQHIQKELSTRQPFRTDSQLRILPVSD